MPSYSGGSQGLCQLSVCALHINIAILSHVLSYKILPEQTAFPQNCYWKVLPTGQTVSPVPPSFRHICLPHAPAIPRAFLLKRSLTRNAETAAPIGLKIREPKAHARRTLPAKFRISTLNAAPGTRVESFKGHLTKTKISAPENSIDHISETVRPIGTKLGENVRGTTR